ncbi:MAG: hypothetical protein CBARDCOR_3685 [uncultured Caballeronia sp.]|nr:MAG: hypothetical protein CBARDCOR_3685 [uncultured Caballeronia sp.]
MAPAQACAARLSHERCGAGCLTPKKTWTLPQSRALWLSPDIDHELHAVGELQLCRRLSRAGGVGVG